MSSPNTVALEQGAGAGQALHFSVASGGGSGTDENDKIPEFDLDDPPPTA